MVRPSQDADAPYVDGMVHGDGLTSLQFRRTKGAITEQIELGRQGRRRHPARAQGQTYIFSAAKFGEPFTTAQIADVNLGDEVLVGLALCSHNADVTERASSATSASSARRRTGFVPYRDYIGSVLEISTCQSGHRQIIHRSAQPFEAPNWTPDGRALIYNPAARAKGAGGLYRFDLATRQSTLDRHRRRQPQQQRPRAVVRRHDARHQRPEPGLGRPVDDLHGAGRRRHAEAHHARSSPSYLHSWSPDGKVLIFTGGRDSEFDIYRIPSDGSGTGGQPHEVQGAGRRARSITPDGKYIYFNSVRSGTMQIWRMKPDGTNPEQITNDEFNNWFPHISPGRAVDRHHQLPEGRRLRPTTRTTSASTCG